MRESKIIIKVVAFLGALALVLPLGLLTVSTENSNRDEASKFVNPGGISVVSVERKAQVGVVENLESPSMQGAFGFSSVCGRNLSSGNSIQGFSGLVLNQSGNCYSLSGVSAPALSLPAISVQNNGLVKTQVVVKVLTAKISAFKILPGVPVAGPKAAFTFYFALALVAGAVVLRKFKPRELVLAAIGGCYGQSLSPAQLMVFRC